MVRIRSLTSITTACVVGTVALAGTAASSAVPRQSTPAVDGMSLIDETYTVDPGGTVRLSLLVTGDGNGGLFLDFDELAGAQRYNLYAGSLDALGAGGWDHGGDAGGPWCAAPTDPAGAGLHLALAAALSATLAACGATAPPPPPVVVAAPPPPPPKPPKPPPPPKPPLPEEKLPKLPE